MNILKNKINLTGRINKELTPLEIMNVNKKTQKIFGKIIKEIDKDLLNLIKKTVDLMKLFSKDEKKGKLELMILLHREIMKHLVLYPVKQIRIARKGKERITDENAYIYNLAIAKDIIDSEMIETGAVDKLAEAIFTSENKKPDEKDMSYIG